MEAVVHVLSPPPHARNLPMFPAALYTPQVTAILHAGRLSLDTGSLVRIVYGRAPEGGPEGAVGGEVAGVGVQDGGAGGAGEVQEVPVRVEVVGGPVRSQGEAKV